MASPGILFVANELGSFRHHREHVLRAARQEGFAPKLMTAPVGDASGVDYDYRPTRIERFRFAPILDSLLFWRILVALLSERPAIAHFINLKPYLFGGLAAGLARLLGWRGQVVMTVPGLGRLYGDAAAGNRYAVFRRMLVEPFLHVAARGAQVTFETVADRDVWVARRLIRPEQATTTSGTGVDLRKFAPGQRRDGRHLNVLFAGRLLRSKGIDIYLRAAALLRNPAIRMRVAGFSETDPDAVSPELLKTCPDIEFLGQVSDMDRLLRETDLVVLPSRYREGVPRILLEAVACGCVVIATRFPGSAMLIEPGETGYLLEAETDDDLAEELAARIGALCDDPALRTAIGQAAAEKVRRSGFSNEDVAEVFLELYRRALK